MAWLQARADQETVLKQQALLREQEFDRLQEIAQKEKENRRRAEGECCQREDDRHAADRALGKDTPQHAKLDKPEDIDIFLLMFQQDMTTGVMKLIPLLDGRSSRMVVQLSLKDKGDFGKVKTSLLKLHNIDSQAFRVCWHLLRMKRDESCWEMAQRRLMHFDGWSKEADTKEKLQNLVTMEHLLQAIPECIQIWVRDQKPTDPLAMA